MELHELIKISKFAGERFDLVQAGGGNSSVKRDGEMLIKSSGYHLSEISENKGYSVVDNKKIISFLKGGFSQDRELNSSKALKMINESILQGERPSIETLLHSMFKKYTLHTHPLSINVICASKNWQEILNKIFQGEKIICVKYKTPGIELALELKKEIQKAPADIVFLQNHGLIISSDNVDDIMQITDYVVAKVDKYLKVDFERYKLTNKISKLVNKGKKIAYLSEDIVINNFLKNNVELFQTKPFCPDKLVYCSSCPVFLNSLSSEQIKEYSQKYGDTPKVIIYNNCVFFIGTSVQKCKEVEEVFKFHLLTVSKIEKEQRCFLSDEDIVYLQGWEAEKYRQKL